MSVLIFLQPLDGYQVTVSDEPGPLGRNAVQDLLCLLGGCGIRSLLCEYLTSDSRLDAVAADDEIVCKGGAVSEVEGDCRVSGGVLLIAFQVHVVVNLDGGRQVLDEDILEMSTVVGEEVSYDETT